MLAICLGLGFFFILLKSFSWLSQEGFRKVC